MEPRGAKVIEIVNRLKEPGLLLKMIIGGR